jgi:octaprenyl-diphosphate synthase
MALGKLGTALTAGEILGLVSGDLEKMESELRLESVGNIEAVSRIARHLQGNGGKRLRPILLLVSCRLYQEPNAAAIRLASVVELIHTATLVHDDVIDEAKTRRGQPAANIIWGNAPSVLAGDWLYMQAFHSALKLRSHEILDLLITLTQQMVDGELLQLGWIGKIGVTEADSMELIDRKTASLFSACTRLGAIAGGASEHDQLRLGDFGWNLGMAFQLADDMLDFTSRESVLGKPVGNDLREGKVTLPLIYALEQSTPEERQLVERVLADSSYEHVPFASIRQLIDRYQGIERTRERAREFTEKARALLAGLPDSPAQRALIAATDLVTGRDR